jgi:hypothetical protein
MLIFISGFIYVFLLGFQQQNITHEHHAKSVIVSYALAAAMYYLIQGIFNHPPLIFILLFGSGSALGASLSILAHKWFRRPRAGEWI